MRSRCNCPLATKAASMPKSPCRVLQVMGALWPLTATCVPSIQLSKAVELGSLLYQGNVALKALRFLPEAEGAMFYHSCKASLSMCRSNNEGARFVSGSKGGGKRLNVKPEILPPLDALTDPQQAHEQSQCGGNEKLPTPKVSKLAQEWDPLQTSPPMASRPLRSCKDA